MGDQGPGNTTSTFGRSLVVLAAVLLTAAPAPAASDPRTDGPAVFQGPVATASCGPGSLPETDIQGRVPKADRLSGRSAKGYRCNLELVGRSQGQGASWVNPSLDRCSYTAQHFPGAASSPGVQVIDASDPAKPKRTATLSSPAMLGTWESLKVHPGRKLLAGTSSTAPIGQGVGALDLYDVSDCAQPKLLNSITHADLALPANTIGHEGDFSPDGRTYWSASAYEGLLTAIDISDPTRPRVLFVGRTGNGNHGFGFSPDGTKLYMAQAGRLGSGALLTGIAAENLLTPNGMQVFDVTEIQRRLPDPRIQELGSVAWDDGAAGQHAIPVTFGGRDHVIFIDELLSGGPRIIDVSDPTKPMVVAKLKLGIQMDVNEALRKSDTTNPVLFGYDAHYCTVDRATDPTALACGQFASGIRVFDLREPTKPREIAYYNPPAQTDKNGLDLPASEHAAAAGDMTTDWCSSPPRFVGDQLWATCQDNGFMTLRFTNGAFPFPKPTGACSSRRRFVIRLPRLLRRATVTLNGRRLKVTRRGGRLTATVDLVGTPRVVTVVRISGRTRTGRRLTQKRTYHPCRRAA